MPPRKLVLADIEDLRQYERGRDEYRRGVIDLKRRRRVSLGTLLSLVFENHETMRFQVQEMARAEKMVTDEQIQGELDVYNSLIPAPGELSATLLIELTDDEGLRRWLPRLVGIERALELRVGAGPGALQVPSEPEAAHAEQLTREEVTASVHYVRFAAGVEATEAFVAGPVFLASTHPEYQEETELLPEVRRELAGDLAP